MKALLEVEVPKGDSCFGFCNERHEKYKIKGYCSHYFAYDTTESYDCSLFRTDLKNEEKCTECKAMRTE